MDSFTAQANPGNMTLEGKKPSSFFRAIFLLLLIVTLAAAGVTTYLLLSRQSEAPAPVTTTETENPFTSTAADSSNPFATGALTQSQGETVNPFAEETSDNPFSQFDTTANTSTTTRQSDYENPF